jgi:hypothetical protein
LDRDGKEKAAPKRGGLYRNSVTEAGTRYGESPPPAAAGAADSDPDDDSLFSVLLPLEEESPPSLLPLDDAPESASLPSAGRLGRP